MSKKTTNMQREKIIKKGYATKTDVCVFLCCGILIGYPIFDKIREEVILEGKLNIPNRINVKRLLPYVDMTEEEIFKYAAMERESLGYSL